MPSVWQANNDQHLVGLRLAFFSISHLIVCFHQEHHGKQDICRLSLSTDSVVRPTNRFRSSLRFLLRIDYRGEQSGPDYLWVRSVLLTTSVFIPLLHNRFPSFQLLAIGQVGDDCKTGYSLIVFNMHAESLPLTKYSNIELNWTVFFLCHVLLFWSILFSFFSFSS